MADALTLDRAEQSLVAAEALTRKIARRLAEAVSDRGKVSVPKLDRRQIDAFRFATMIAEQRAGRAILAYARRVGGDVPEALALAFIGEVVGSMAGEVVARRSAWQVDLAEIAATVASPEVAEFVTASQEGERWEALYELTRDKGTGPYGLDAERDMIRKEFRRFAENKVMPVAEHVHRHDDLVPKDIIEGVAEMGCFGLSIPEQYGGLQPDDQDDNLGMVIVTEELSRGSLGVAGSLITRPEIMSKTLLKGGTEAQKQRWLPRLATGETLCAIAVTEPDFGSDVAGVKVSGTRTDGGWLINGQKTWCTFGGYADVMLVLTRTDPDPAAKHRGLSVMIAEKPRFEGHSFEYEQEGGGKINGRAIDTLGYRGMHSFDVWFEDYFVPDANVVGEEGGIGKGFYYQMEGFSGGRLQTAARATGVMQAAYDAAVTYAHERKVFRQPIAAYQLTQWKLARMATIVQVARQFTYETARLLDTGEGQMEASLVKLWTSRIAEWVTREAMQIHGGMGYAEEYEVSRLYVDARVFSIFEGAEEVLALRVVARQVLQAALNEGAEA